MYIYGLDNNYNIRSNRKQKKETRPFSHGWYYQLRLKGWAQALPCPPPFSLGSYYEPGLKHPFNPGWFTHYQRGPFVSQHQSRLDLRDLYPLPTGTKAPLPTGDSIPSPLSPSQEQLELRAAAACSSTMISLIDMLIGLILVG
jgi:hypothetical protein